MKQVRLFDNIALIYGSGAVEYYKVLAIDMFKYEDTHSEILAGATGTFAEIANLNPPNDMVYLVDGVGVDGNVKFFFKQPATHNRFGVERAPESMFLTERGSPVVAPASMEMAIIENYPPNVKKINHTNKAITATLIWYGRKFRVRKLKTTPSAFTPFSIGGASR